MALFAADKYGQDINPNRNSRRLTGLFFVGATALSACGIAAPNVEHTETASVHAVRANPNPEISTTSTTVETNSALVNSEKLVSNAVARLKAAQLETYKNAGGQQVTGIEGLDGGMIFASLQRVGAMVSISQSELSKVGESSTATNADQLVPDPSPQSDSKFLIQHAHNMPSGYNIRSERHNANYSYTANHYLPVYAHVDGTPEPGQQGNALFFAHDITEAASAIEFDALQNGDDIIVFNVDQATNVTNYYIYKVKGGPEIYPEEDSTAIENYVDPDGNPNTLSIYFCWPQGQDAHRMVFRAVQVNSINAQNSPDLQDVSWSPNTYYTP